MSCVESGISASPTSTLPQKVLVLFGSSLMLQVISWLHWQRCACCSAGQVTSLTQLARLPWLHSKALSLQCGDHAA
eukprot:4157766-Amphidinium_carterae.1